MTGRLSIALMSAAALGWLPTTVSAQFPVLVTDFEGAFSSPIFFAEVIFRDPSFSGTTRGLDTLVGDDSYLSSTVGAPPPFTQVHSGTQAMVAFWGWEDAANHTSWIRLATTDTTDIPNPALHLGGEVRLWLGARAWTNDTFATLAPGGNLFVGIGVRETGIGAPQGADGGISGTVEWVGLSDKLVEIVAGTNGMCDTAADPESDDVQVTEVGQPAPSDGACVDAGTNGFLDTAASGDDTVATTPVGLFAIPADGVMREYVFNLPDLEAADSVFGLTGDAVLGASPNNRGTLEHLVLTNDPNNGAANANVFLVFIDDVTFKSPILDPPVIRVLPDPPRPLDQVVTVDQIDPAADLVELIQLPDTPLGSVDPDAASVDIETSPLPSGVSIVARQTVGADLSDNSTPVLVISPGNGPLRIAMAIRETDQHDAGLECGDDGTGFDPNAPSTLEFVGATSTSQFGVPDAPRYPPQADWFEISIDPCTDGVTIFSGDGVINVNSNGETVGVWEGLYFRIDSMNPTTGPFTVYVDDVTVKNAYGPGMDCMLDDFESYTPADYVVGDFDGDAIANTTAEATDVQVVAVGSPVFPGQIIVAPGADGTLETAPDGDDVLSALHARFNYPGVAGTSIGLADSPDLTRVTDEDAFSGTQSLKVEWAFVDAVGLNNTLRLTSNGSLATDPPETFLNPDPVIPLTFAGCEDGVDIAFSFMIRLAPPPVPGDCDGDGDVDLGDYACMQRCFGASPVPEECEKLDLSPIGAPDDVINLDDYELFAILLLGPR